MSRRSPRPAPRIRIPDRTDVKPVPGADARSITASYVVVGWVIGGYLIASLLGIAFGRWATTRGGSALRHAGFAASTLASGPGGTLVVTRIDSAPSTRRLSVTAA